MLQKHILALTPVSAHLLALQPQDARVRETQGATQFAAAICRPLFPQDGTVSAASLRIHL